jgi:hypothetical protein
MSTHALQDKDLETYYSALFEMYGTPGWKKLMEDVGRLIETHDRLVGIETSEQLWHRHGFLEQARWLQNHQPASEFAYQSLLEEQGVEEDATGGRATVVGPAEAQ